MKRILQRSMALSILLSAMSITHVHAGSCPVNNGDDIESEEALYEVSAPPTPLPMESADEAIPDDEELVGVEEIPLLSETEGIVEDAPQLPTTLVPDVLATSEDEQPLPEEEFVLLDETLPVAQQAADIPADVIEEGEELVF